MKTCINTRSILLALGLSMAAPLAMANCTAPTFDTAIPDGKSTSQDLMDKVYADVTQFVKMGEEFIACAESNEGRAAAKRMRDQMLDEMENVAAQFNRQLRLFKRANS